MARAPYGAVVWKDEAVAVVWKDEAVRQGSQPHIRQGVAPASLRGGQYIGNIEAIYRQYIGNI